MKVLQYRLRYLTRMPVNFDESFWDIREDNEEIRVPLHHVMDW